MSPDTTDLGSTITNQLASVFNSIILFIPNLITGIILLVVGWIIASVLRNLTRRLLISLNIGKWFNRAELQTSQNVWVNVISQLVFWMVFIIFLVPVFEAFHLQQVNQLINQLVLYIPRVIASVIVAFIGIIFANLLSEAAGSASSSYGKQTSNILASVARYSIIGFTALIVLNLLGVAPSLIQIFLAGLMLAFAIATGLAVGLGAKDFISDLLSQLGRSLKK